MSQANFKSDLGYEGKVTLTLKSKGRVLKTKVYKNRGTANLFKFFGYCLIDSYEEAKKLLPSKIMLLHNIGESPNGQYTPDTVSSSSPFKSYEQTPTIVSSPRSDSDNNNAGWVKVTYSFEIPKTIIEAPFNQIALYGAGMEDEDFREFSAYYFLTDSFGEFELLDPEKDEWSATTVLLVEWELTLANM